MDESPEEMVMDEGAPRTNPSPRLAQCYDCCCILACVAWCPVQNLLTLCNFGVWRVAGSNIDSAARRYGDDLSMEYTNYIVEGQPSSRLAKFFCAPCNNIEDYKQDFLVQRRLMNRS